MLQPLLESFNHSRPHNAGVVAAFVRSKQAFTEEIPAFPELSQAPGLDHSGRHFVIAPDGMGFTIPPYSDFESKREFFAFFHISTFSRYFFPEII